MDTKNFKTKSEILQRKLPRVLGNNQHKTKTIVALDGGYSAVKGASPNKIFRFPSYAKKAPSGLEIISKVDDEDLQFKNNKTGEIWLVGKSAETLMNSSDINATTDASLYTRYRYNSEIFKVIMITGLALGLVGTGQPDEIYLQTGLPSAYKTRDEDKIKDALCGDYDISLKIGMNPWVHLEFELKKDNIGVMEQPQGTLCACAYKDGETTPEGVKLLKSKGTIILDIGFGTEDIFAIKSGYKNDHQTYSDTGMKAVFERVSKTIKEEYDADVKIFELQSFLDSGIFTYLDPDTFSTVDVDFSNILEETNKFLCEKSIKRLVQEYDNLLGYEYLIVTGGTGESRYEQICDLLSGFTRLKIMAGNLNTPDLNFAYSNVLGYYMFRHAIHLKESKQ